MNQTTCLTICKRLISCTLALYLSAGILIANKARAQSLTGLTDTTQDLLEVVKISNDLLELVLQGKIGARTTVIVQSKERWSLPLDLLVLTLGGKVTATYNNFNIRTIDLPLGSVLALAASLNVAYISLDRPVNLLGHVSETSGADAVTVSNDGYAPLDGSSIGIAVLDSGIYTAHRSFLGKNNNLRVVLSKDFTGENRTDDPYGHGTHVASIAAGNGRISNGEYVGIAPNANIINLRVLNAQGTGSTSSLLKALDWVLSNRATHNIRVVNLSLGGPAIDSYRNDPACKAVRRLVDAGIVVVTAAGNHGQNASGQKTYGQVHSPGNEPAAITAGASNSYGTGTRGDDTMTTYSSRGPTRSYWTDFTGLKHYDNLIKPDIVASGNKIVGAQAVNNLLVSQHPELSTAVSSVDNRKMMRLSGTSMSAPVVAGAAALVLQANPKLTPNMVKAILMYTSQPLAGYNMLEQGAGQLNVEGAVRLARLFRSDLTNSTSLGAPLLTGNPPSPQSTISGYTFSWSQGLMLNYTYATGADLITRYQKIYGTGLLLSDGVVAGDGVIAGDMTMITSGFGLGDNIMTSDGVIAGDGYIFCPSAVFLRDGVLLTDGQLLGDGVIAGDAVGVIAGDTQQCGDNTAAMSAPPDNE